MQGATGADRADLPGDAGFNPRPLCRERLSTTELGFYQGGFQSTPPMQGATRNVVTMAEEMLFQSTPPMQGATEPL